jgi:PAS domain S-box-containing protein
LGFFIFSALFFRIYSDIKKKAVANLNDRQMVYAQLAAAGIEEEFRNHLKTLQYLAKNKDVIHLTSNGRDLLNTLQAASPGEIRSVTRVDARGKIAFTAPEVARVVGSDISGQTHIQTIFQTKKPVLSDVFLAEQGFQAVALHVPVFRDRIFDGTLGFLISFDTIAKKYLDNIKIETFGYAWMISEKGVEIYCPIPGHVGNSVLDNCKDFPDILEMAHRMMKGEKGVTTYTFEQKTKAGEMATLKKHAVYMPIKIVDTFWSIVVATPENEVLSEIASVRNQLLTVFLILFLIFSAIAYAVARLQAQTELERKKRQMEDGIYKSAREIHDLYNNAPCGYHSLDADGRFVRINDTELSWLGYKREELMGRPYADVLTEASRPRFAAALARLKGDKVLQEEEYELRRKDGSCFTALVTSSALTDAQGQFVMTRSMALNITERRRQEERLRESEELYRKALESTSDGVTITDVETERYVYVNQRLLKTLGRPNENLVGAKADIYVHPDDVGLGKKFFNIRKRENKESSYFESRIVRPDGSITVIGVTATDIIYQNRPAVIAFITDITERKRVENALRESEELYRTALETTNDGVTITQDGVYVYINQRMLNTLGRPHENLIGTRQGKYVHPDDWSRIEEAYRKRQKGEPLYTNYEIRVFRPDQSMIYLHISAVRIIYKGKPAILTFAVDVTKRKEAEEALRESEELYRTAVESTNDGIAIVQYGKYVYANPKLLQTIGRDAEDFIGQPLGVFTIPEDRDRVLRLYAANTANDGKPLRYDMRVFKPDGSILTLDVSSVTVRYKGRPALISFIMDVTERKKAEEALRQSEEKYRTIIESIEDDYFETDLEGTITFINKPCDWTGRTREELIGMNHRQYASPEMADKVAAVFKQIYRDGVPARVTDYQVFHKDGGVCHLEMSVSLIRDASGSPVGFRGISRDVTDRLRMEEERKKLTEQLYQAQKMEAIGTLAGGIAHDFNNLLMGIQGYASIMLLEVDAAHPFYDQLKAIQTLVQSGASLTKQLLGFARAGRYEVVATDLNDLIQKTVVLFGRTKKEIQIHEKYDEPLRTVEVDRGQIEQVLLNLFVNAWQAMPGGGSLYVETENVIFDKTSADLYDVPPGAFVKISVTDTGVGMDEKTRQRIFDPFFTTKGMGRGTGLGLASAYGIIKGHGGMIRVYSEKGHGTTFNIYLPASAKQAQIPQTGADAHPAGGRETILLVDDEDVITEVAGRLLRELGYTILTASSGEQALEIYRQQKSDIDLVVLDMIMPAMSGGETFERLKAINPDVRVILSSGYSIDGKAQAIMKKGARVFLQKPYRLNDLAQKIREALAD